jgi:hypothetical protein
MNGATFAYVGMGMNATFPLWLKVITAIFEIWIIAQLLRMSFPKKSPTR